jgi:hypothetical protein
VIGLRGSHLSKLCTINVFTAFEVGETVAYNRDRSRGITSTSSEKKWKRKVKVLGEITGGDVSFKVHGPRGIFMALELRNMHKIRFGGGYRCHSPRMVAESSSNSMFLSRAVVLRNVGATI